VRQKTNLGYLEVLVLDNYDSFTYNLVDSLRSLGVLDFGVMANDQIQWDLVNNCKKILISPGPGTPKEAGDLLKLIRKYHQSKSILGICLGHQAIAQVFGGQLINLQKPRHGQTVAVNLSTTDPLFTGIPKKIKGGLYHSWSVDPANLPQDLQVIASSGDRIMGIRHARYDVTGVQFHPESYATPYGVEILRNWL
jgi:anthranilate synthase component 2